MPDSFFSDESLTSYAQQRVTLYPEKFGYMGSFSKELLRGHSGEELAAFGTDTVLLRLTTSVLCGSTVSENPKVEIGYPASPWQHVKHEYKEKIGRLGDRWKGHDPDTREAVTPPWWLVLLWPLLVLAPKWYKKYPVKWGKVTADVRFEQRVLYPEIDAPAHAGRPVIYETIDMNWAGPQPPWGGNLARDPSRFLSRHEIARAVFKDPGSARYGVTLGPDQTLNWLERHGVNVDQLVKRGNTGR